MKPCTLCLITCIMIAVIFTFLILLVIMREKIRELLSSCFGGRQERIDAKVDEMGGKSREKEPPPCVPVDEACVMPKELTLREKIEAVEEEFKLGRIEREHVSRLKSEEMERESKRKDQEIDEEYTTKVEESTKKTNEKYNELIRTSTSQNHVMVLQTSESLDSGGFDNKSQLKKANLTERLRKIQEDHDAEIKIMDQEQEILRQETHQAWSSLADVMAECVQFNNRDRSPSISSNDSGVR